MTAFWRTWYGTDGTPSVADSGNHQIGIVLSFSGAARGEGDPFEVSGTTVDATIDTSGTIGTLTTTVDDCLIIAGVGTNYASGGSPTNFFSGWTNAGLSSITEHSDYRQITSGIGGAIGTVSGGFATAGATGGWTFTMTRAVRKGVVAIALLPETYVAQYPVTAGTNIPTPTVQLVRTYSGASTAAIATSSGTMVSQVEITPDAVSAGSDVAAPLLRR